MNELEKIKRENKKLKNIIAELGDPIFEYESKDDNHFMRREAFLDLEGKLRYGYTIYKWDGTYTEKEMSPITKKTFKFKNWVECMHFTSTDKIENFELKLKQMLELEKVLNEKQIGEQK